MYEAYWNLKCKPFDDSLTEEFYYPAETHQGALLKLRYAIEHRRGAAVLAASAGLGKTLLIRTLFDVLAADLQPKVHLVFPQMPHDQLTSFVAAEICGGTNGCTTLDQAIRRLRDFLAENTAAGRHTVLAIDEAQLLVDIQSLQVMRLLLNFQSNKRPDLTLLLVAQPTFLAHLHRAQELDERIGVKCLLRPFSQSETDRYIHHRLTVAGAARRIFEPDAVVAVHEVARGIPRRINRICDLALLIGFAEERSTLGPEQIRAVAEELVAIRPDLVLVD
jgi:general secretion pathway protein A